MDYPPERWTAKCSERDKEKELCHELDDYRWKFHRMWK